MRVLLDAAPGYTLLVECSISTVEFTCKQMLFLAKNGFDYFRVVCLTTYRVFV